MPTWPTELPQSPDLQGYSERPKSQVLRTSMDAGPAKTRRRFSAATREIPVRFMLTRAQAELFEQWFETDLQAGSLPFDVPQPRTGAVVSVLIAGDPPYQLNPMGSGMWWSLSCTFEVQP